MSVFVYFARPILSFQHKIPFFVPGGSNCGVDLIFDGPDGANEAGYRKDLLDEVRVA